MFSDRLYKMIFQICTLGREFGSFPIEFDTKLGRISILKEYKLNCRVTRNKYLSLIWVAAAFKITTNEFLHGQFNLFLVKFFFTLSSCCICVVCSIIYACLNDVLIFLNGFLVCFRNIHSKL